MKIFSRFSVALFLAIASVNAQEKICTNLDQLDSHQAQQIKEQIKTDANLVSALYQITYDAVQVLDRHHIPYSLAFGSLLGAVRSKGILHHDDDVDLMFDTVDAPKLEETKKVFSSLGYNLFKDPSNIVGYKLYSKTKIKLATGEEVLPFIDLFEFYQDLDAGYFAVLPSEGRRIFHKAKIPVAVFKERKIYSFGGINVQGLANPEVFLTDFYGASWNQIVYVSHKHSSILPGTYLWLLTDADRVPAQPTGLLKPRVQHYFETGISPAPLAANNYGFWDSFYARQNLELTPSTFAEFLVKNHFIKAGKSLVDIACGNGRDTLYFQKLGLKAVGIDASKSAIELNREKVTDHDSFQVVDINDHEGLARFLGSDYVYARFFIHSISDAEQKRFMDFLMGMKTGAKLLLEFRTDKDPMFKKSSQLSKTEGVTDHYRRYINFEIFCADLESRGFEVGYRIEADSLSVRGEDNPYLGRIVAVQK